MRFVLTSAVRWAYKGVCDFAAQIVVSIVTTVCMSLLGSHFLARSPAGGAVAPPPVAVSEPAVAPSRLAAFAHPLFFSATASPYQASYTLPATLPATLALADPASAPPCSAGCSARAETERQQYSSRIAVEYRLEAAATDTHAGETRWLPMLGGIGRTAGAVGERLAGLVPKL